MEAYSDEDAWGLKEAFSRIVLFDAWIGNSDRHQENWGVILEPDGSPRIAPMYDPASCLGVELTDEHLLLNPSRRQPQDITRYVRRCNSGFGDGEKMLRQEAVVRGILEWNECASVVEDFVEKLDLVCQHSLEILQQFPERWLSLPRRDLAFRLLVERMSWLREEVRR